MRYTISIITLATVLLGILPCSVSSLHSQTLKVQHALEVQLLPTRKMLQGKDIVEVSGLQKDQLLFSLHPEATIQSVEVNNKSAAYRFESGRGRIFLPQEATGSVRVAIEYQGVFDDPFEARPLSTDNPGFGVSGTIFEQGAFLLAGSGWYPDFPAEHTSFELQVHAPKGMRAVTAGRLVDIQDGPKGTTSTWEAENPVRGLSLSAGPYIKQERRIGQTRLYTFFYPVTQRLSSLYLEKTEEHIRFFEELHGPYAFPKFAVVENFFPTGYGFPSYTLLGTAVLQLPFIPETSLKHEVSHCWWGNGVLVAFEQGNWSEGLTTYVSDYLSRELSSEREGREYRMQVLRDYALLAAGEEDLPLSGFAGRIDPATRAVGYGKAMFVFHMARKRMGDAPFWKALQEVYRERLFKKTSWNHFGRAFAANSDWDQQAITRFLQQWISRTGAPVLDLGEVSVKREGDQWIARGDLLQKKPYYDLEVPVVLETESGETTQMLELTGRSQPFVFKSQSRPTRLRVDPDGHVFRLLYPEEIPATINSLKGARQLTAIVGGSLGDEWLPLVEGLLVSLNQEKTPVVRESDVKEVPEGDVLLFGYPRSAKLQALVPDLPRTSLSAGDFLFQGYPAEAGDGLFLVHKSEERRMTTLFVTEEETTIQAAWEMVRKITHYGKYSYLLFHQNEVAEKGTWEPAFSPLDIAIGDTK